MIALVACDSAESSGSATDSGSGRGGSGSIAGPTTTTTSGGDGGGSGSADATSAGSGGDPGTTTSSGTTSGGTADPDTDGDTYLDGDEVLEGTDPLDPESRIYAGGWPYQHDKDQIADPGFDGEAAVGSVIPRLVVFDQFGEEVDLYDFAFHGKPVVIELSAIWCAACKDLSNWLEGKPSSFDETPQWAPIVDAVRNGEIFWITVIFEDAQGNPAGPEHAVAWAEAFPDARITILADNDRALYDHLFPGGFPSIQVLNEDMTIEVYDRFYHGPALDALIE